MSERAPGTPRRRASREGGQRGMLGLLLLLLAGLIGPDGLHLPGPRPGDETHRVERSAARDPTSSVVTHAHDAAFALPGRPLGEPVADMLAPLGPIKAVLSAALWVAFSDQLAEGGGDDVTALAEGLLALHPGLVRVRVHLAEQLTVNEAARAPDEARHRAYVQAGLDMLTEGLDRADDPRLHQALGRLVFERSLADPRFAQVAEASFGMSVGDIVIEELRAATRDEQAQDFDLAVLAGQLVARGLDQLERFDDTWSAGRDLHEAERVLGRVDNPGVASLVDRLDDLRAAWQRASERERGNS